MDIPHTNIRWHFPVNRRWTLRFRGAIPGHGAHAAQVSRHGAQLPTLTWNFEAPRGGGKQGTCWELVVEIRGIGCWCFLSRFLGDFGRRVCRIVALGGSNQLHQLQEIRRKTAWSDPFIVIYRNLWGNPWTQLQCATTSDYCPRSAPGERGERGEANDLYDLNILKLGLFIVIGHRQFKYTLFHLLIWLS